MDSDDRSVVRKDVYRTITDKIVAAIEKGAGEFQMPWHQTRSVARPVNAHTRQSYRGVNVLALWVEAFRSGFASAHWATYRQWQALGAQVRKGEQGSTIIFYKRLGDDASSEEEGPERPRLIARASWVFNAQQVDGWKEPTPAESSRIETLAQVETFIGQVGAVIRYGGSQAYYDRRFDLVMMPPRGLFRGTATSSAMDSYYAVLLHELTHWSGASQRLDRQFGERFGDQAYAVEELVAEMGAAFLCADLGISNEPRPDHAAYVASWLNVLKQDSRALFTAASKASQAAEFLLQQAGQFKP